MTEQVEFSNVVILNKQDLVTKEQQRDILDRVSLLNPKAKVLKSQQSKIDVMEILNTKLFDRKYNLSRLKVNFLINDYFLGRIWRKIQ